MTENTGKSGATLNYAAMESMIRELIQEKARGWPLLFIQEKYGPPAFDLLLEIPEDFVPGGYEGAWFEDPPAFPSSWMVSISSFLTTRGIDLDWIVKHVNEKLAEGKHQVVVFSLDDFEGGDFSDEEDFESFDLVHVYLGARVPELTDQILKVEIPLYLTDLLSSDELAKVLAVGQGVEGLPSTDE